MDIKDLAGFGKAFEKLVDTLNNGVGRITKSYFTRKDADAKAYEIKQLTDATAYKIARLAEATKYAREIDVHAEINNGEIVILQPNGLEVEEPKLLAERASQREEYQQIKEQQNIEQITAHATEELASTVESVDDVSDEEVDPDWISRFFDTAKNISTEDMQKLWGKILAGEIKQPKSFSLRTLDTLKNLTREEANLFIKVAKFSFSAGKEAGVLYHDKGKYFQDNFGISFSDWLYLQELGLVNQRDDLRYTFNRAFINDFSTSILIVGDKMLAIHYLDDTSTVTLSIKKFTTIGMQLLQLVKVTPDLEYIQEIVNAIKKNSENLNIIFGGYISMGGDQFQIKNPIVLYEASKHTK